MQKKGDAAYDLYSFSSSQLNFGVATSSLDYSTAAKRPASVSTGTAYTLTTGSTQGF
jgi:hypothetical protein